MKYNLILAAVFLGLAIIGIILKTTYFATPIIEVKRRAKNADKTATKLYKSVAYDSTLKTLLWLYIGFTSAACFILVARSFAVWISLFIIGPLIYIIFSLLPSLSADNPIYQFVTRTFNPFIAWLLYYIHPIINRGNTSLSKKVKRTSHTGLYEKQDLIRLIEMQLRQKDSRISAMDAELAIHALKFSDKKVSDILTPSSKVKAVYADAVIGPVLIDEIHKSGQSYALVKDRQDDQIVGTLAFADLGIKSSGQVSDLMNKKIFYINENDNLGSALSAIFEANYFALIVINNAQEFIGIITTESILSELIGNTKAESSVDNTSVSAVAAKFSKKADEETIK